MVILPLFEALGNLSLYNYVKKLHIEILYLWVNIVILLDSKNEIIFFGVTAPLNVTQHTCVTHQNVPI